MLDRLRCKMRTGIYSLTDNAYAHMHVAMSAIRYIRKTILGVSQAELAAIAQTTQTTVSRWEKGESAPDLSHLSRIRDVVRLRRPDWRDDYFFDPPAEAAA